MKPAALPLLLALGCMATSVQAAGADCPIPVFPVYSSNSDCVERVERKVREWRLCVAAYRSTDENAQLSRLDQEVEARMEKWLILTRTYANGEPERQRLLNRIERDRSEYLAEQQAAGRIVYAAERK
jgi:hypothetical protein